MSEIKIISEKDTTNLNARDCAHQLLEFQPEKDLVNLVNSLNYYQSALKNPTKNADEALVSLRETLSETRHLVFGAKDIGKLKEVFHEVSKVRHVDFTMAHKMLSEIEAENASGELFALVVSKDLSIGVIINLPNNVES